MSKLTSVLKAKSTTPQSIEQVAELKRDLAKLPKKLKASLVVAALEKAQRQKVSADGLKPEFVGKQKFSNALILEVLKEFHSELNKKLAKKSMTAQETNTTLNRSDPVRNQDSDSIGTIIFSGTRQNNVQAHSLELENPMVSAHILVNIPTVQAKELLQEMQIEIAQRVALYLREVETIRHNISADRRPNIDDSLLAQLI